MANIYTGSAPGRVNLIGEHTDYNGGMVLPAALSVGLEVSLAPRSDSAVAISSSGYDAPAIRDLADDASGEWPDACVGAIREANVLGLLDGGATLDIASTIPEGSGLSSSAALIVAILKAARARVIEGPSDVDIAIAARRVENRYMNVPCGIMDQMAVALATPGTAMALDTKKLAYGLVPLPASHEMVVVHSGVTRKLTDGRYAARKEECDAAKRYFRTEDLCLLNWDTVSASDLDETPKKRTLHCIGENTRVHAAIAALDAGNIAAFGDAMNESHVSMRDLFEMSLPEIDALVASATDLGAVGARLTGGGFGGCIVACIEKGAREDWLEALLSRHPESRFIDAVSGG
ncbi:galactokinase [Erythrobacter sp. THAF29]|uniref:galactokinase n=1 Tax=Erythrobacter sp. THAF29 TaxID=2587851 RepID=UPI001268928B|nr:galactokinase [Erythrobacter sp. THAF29]QFT78551.1 Galactokinase [Erythrobacter sp. THAF29]